MGATYPRVRSRAVATARSSGPVIFRLVASPGTTTTVPPTASTRAASSVASALVGVGGAQQVGPEGLRGLHRHQVGAVEGLDHHGVAVLVVADPLDGVGDRHGRDDGVGPGVHRGHHGLVELGRRQRPGGVVHDDHGGVGVDDGERGPHRVGPLGPTLDGHVGGAALDQRLALGLVGGGQHHHHVVGGGAAPWRASGR